MPFLMSLEGPKLAPWAAVQDSIYQAVPREAWWAQRQLAGVFDPITTRPFWVFAGLLAGMWYANRRRR